MKDLKMDKEVGIMLMSVLKEKLGIKQSKALIRTFI